MCYVYILQNEKGKKYVGSTSNLRRRLKRHNEGAVKSTKKGWPWKVVYYKAHRSKTLALKTEIFYKTSQGRRQLKKKLDL